MAFHKLGAGQILQVIFVVLFPVYFLFSLSMILFIKKGPDEVIHSFGKKPQKAIEFLYRILILNLGGNCSATLEEGCHEMQETLEGRGSATSFIHSATFSACMNLAAMSDPSLKEKVRQMADEAGLDVWSMDAVPFPAREGEPAGGVTVTGIIGSSAIYLHCWPGLGDGSVQAMVHSCVDEETTKEEDKAKAVKFFGLIKNYFRALRFRIYKSVEHPVEVSEALAGRQRVSTLRTARA